MHDIVMFDSGRNVAFGVIKKRRQEFRQDHAFGRKGGRVPG